jgi:hypothetical protein
MIKKDEKSNAQSWELEIVCKNSKYMKAVVNILVDYGKVDFEVELVDVNSNYEEFDGRYLVLICGDWFGNLSDITKKLNKIEKRLENF